MISSLKIKMKLNLGWPGNWYRMESRRVDNQARGRSGRQGDEGSQFYVSLEDDLMRIFGSESMTKMLEKLGLKMVRVLIILGLIRPRKSTTKSR